MNADPRALAVQLRFMTTRTGQAGIVASWPPLDGCRDVRLADPDRQAVRIGIRVCGLWDQAQALAVRIGRNSSSLPGTSRFRKMSYEMTAEP